MDDISLPLRDFDGWLKQINVDSYAASPLDPQRNDSTGWRAANNCILRIAR
jgi:hypothetical protein